MEFPPERLLSKIYNILLILCDDTLPKFRSTVEVDGKEYISTNTFTTRKAAEQDAAKFSLECISKNIKDCVPRNTNDGGFSPIHKDKMFSKPILYEFAMKKNLEKPTYYTVKLESAFPHFVLSLVFDGVKYTGEPSANKKEAEQLAARVVILSVLANSGVDTLLSEIVKSKAKLISAAQQQYTPSTESAPEIPDARSDVSDTPSTESAPQRPDASSDVSDTPSTDSAPKKPDARSDVSDTPSTGADARCSNSFN
ncbi:hypothetical protein RND81_11G151600 [Saponaria officinalis]|uniref:DRBM domain-containing protein n=1 Tax=Saponaria officinalis TaxID=3572 RepID=A0AAW1HMF9_SAPOF